MKKVLAALLVLLMVASVFASCSNNDAETGTDTATEAGEKQLSQELVDGAAEMVYEYNKPGIDNSVSSSFTLPTAVDYEDNTFDVEWKVEGGNGLVSLANAEEGKTTVVIDPYADADTEFKLIGTVKGGEFTKDVELNYKIKAFAVADWKYWSENTKDVSMNIRGVIVAKYPYNDANKNIGVFLQDLDGQHGYFAYRMKCNSKEEADTQLAIGNVIIVNGTTSIYNGFREMGTGCTYSVVLGSDGKPTKGEIKTVSLDEFFKEGAVLATALDPYQGVIGKITDAKIKSIDWNSNNAENYVEKGAGSVYVTVTKNGIDFKLYLSTSNTLSISELQAEYEKLAVGYTIDVEGPISWYNEPQIYPCAGGITVKSTDISNEEKVTNELNAINIIPSTVSSDTTIKLGGTGVNYSDVKFTWELPADGGAATLKDDVLTVKVGKAIASVTLKVTAECGGAKADKEFKISVMPADMSEEDIVNALYTLEKGEVMDGTYTLTGKITEVVTAYSDQYKNVTVNMVVGSLTDKPVQCYRLAGDGADKIKAGDTITVTGTLKRYNDTFEFDAACKLDKVVPGTDAPDTTPAETTGEDTKPAPVELKTPKEIIEALYALKDGETIEGSFTLTGKITKVDTPFNTQHNNVTVTIEVDGFASKPVMCYRLKGTGADKIKVGDTITVSGGLKNYKGTYELIEGCSLVKIDKTAPVETETTAPETTAPETTAPETTVSGDPGPKTAKEILEAAYALEQGKALDGEYTLSGTIIQVNTPYDSGYDNVTVTIEVDGLGQYPIQCFRMKGTGADKIKKNDKITVTGKIKNYNGTVEFDAGCSLDKIDFVSENTSPVLDTPEKIVKALYALEKSSSLDGGPYTLTGKITEIPTAWSDEYSNITVVIVVDNLTEYPVTCYRLKGDGAKDLKVGDTITVKGQLTHYYKDGVGSTFEFTSGCTIVK